MKSLRFIFLVFFLVVLTLNKTNNLDAQQIGLITVKNIGPKIITPNGDGFNDRVIIELDNAEGIPVTGEVFDIHGAKVAEFEPDDSSAPDYLYWNGKRGGDAVPSGIYIYQLRAKGKITSGTVVVAR